MKLNWIISLVVVVMGMQGCRSLSVEKQLDKNLLRADEVGAGQMPAEPEKVQSPFTTWNVQRPTFPMRQNTVLPNDDIQGKLDQLAAQGGGTLILKGHHHTGRITLRSHINLQLDAGSVLEFESEIEDFLPVVFTRNEGVELYSLGACIYANGAENIAITGSGRIIGPGEGSVRNKTMTHDVIENIVDSKRPVEQRIYDGRTADFIFPPALIAPINCKRVWIEGVSLERTAFWNIVPTYCEDVVIRGVHIQSMGIPRGDGIDIESCNRVLVEYCTLNTGDDCIAVKAGRGYDGLRVNRPSQDIVVRYCFSEKGHGGFTIGSETAGMAKHVYVHDCVFGKTNVGIRFKTRRPRGGGGSDIYFERIRMQEVESALRWDMLGQAQHVGNQASRDFEVQKNALTPRFSDIQIKDIYIDAAKNCIKIEGIPESVLENVSIDRVFGRGDQYLSIKDAKNIKIKNSVFVCKDTSISTTNVLGLIQDRVHVITESP